MATCLTCRAQLQVGRGRPRKYCLECRPRRTGETPKPYTATKLQQATHGTLYAYNRGCRCNECTTAARERWRTKALKLICADCGGPVSKGKSSLPQGQARCALCRRANPQRVRVDASCEYCGQTFSRTQARRFCSVACSNRRGLANRVRSVDDARTARAAREVDAPGLRATARRRLLSKWRQQARPCTYCPAPATTVDHVVPLVRGGTNHEGNLAPCCKRCNSSKAGWTVIEWRTGRRLPPMTTPLPWCHILTKAKTDPPPVLYKVCPICSATHQRTKYCSNECCTEAGRRSMRDRYRAKVGIPVETSEPSSRWRRDVRYGVLVTLTA